MSAIAKPGFLAWTSGLKVQRKLTGSRRYGRSGIRVKSSFSRAKRTLGNNFGDGKLTPRVKSEVRNPKQIQNPKTQIQNLIFQASSLKPHASRLKPQASSLTPHASSLKPQASSLKPQASSLKPQAFRHFDLPTFGPMPRRVNIYINTPYRRKKGSRRRVAPGVLFGWAGICGPC